MTAIALINALEGEIRKLIGPMPVEGRAVKFFQHTIPLVVENEDDDYDPAPCICIAIGPSNFSDFTAQPHYRVKIAIVVETMDPSGLGPDWVLILVDRIIQRFCKNAYLGPFEAVTPIDYAPNDDVDNWPYYSGIITMGFLGPRVNREDDLA